GDSRCYLFSKGELHQLTTDHTIAAELARHGILSPEKEEINPYRHVVTNVLGGKQQGVQVELHRLDLHPEGVILLWSDGLTEMVSVDQIAAILQEEQEPRNACERLVTQANKQGGKDNITAVVAQISKQEKA